MHFSTFFISSNFPWCYTLNVWDFYTFKVFNFVTHLHMVPDFKALHFPRYPIDYDYFHIILHNAHCATSKGSHYTWRYIKKFTFALCYIWSFAFIYRLHPVLHSMLISLHIKYIISLHMTYKVLQSKHLIFLNFS